MFKNKKIHMLGIGGISMSGIAKILLSFDCKITGYDIADTDVTKDLEKHGIKVYFDENYKAIDDADIIVYTAAIKDDNSQMKYAKKQGKEMYERSTFLGLMMKDYKNVICISGTHGKSTTTGMVSSIFMEAKLNPTIQIGAMLPLIGGNEHVGGKDYFIAESCEYVDSFLQFYPTAEIILNIDDDHLDYFKNINNIIKSFKKYTELLPEDGKLVINNDDSNTLKATKDYNNKITYGIKKDANIMAKNISFDENGHPIYDLYIEGEKKCQIHLGVSGNHNVYNSLAAIAMSIQYDIDLETIKNALSEYHGVGRRFEYLGTYNGANVYDDYAHHPSEIKTTVESVKKTKHKENWAIFQAHTFSRTKEHLQEFADVLTNFDHVVIAKIYPAREINTFNVHEEDIVSLIKANGNENVTYIDDFDKIVDYLKENVKKDDLVITIGAGPVNEVANKLVKSELNS